MRRIFLSLCFNLASPFGDISNPRVPLKIMDHSSHSASTFMKPSNCLGTSSGMQSPIRCTGKIILTKAVFGSGFGEGKTNKMEELDNPTVESCWII